jgi:hypothetical protein
VTTLSNHAGSGTMPLPSPVSDGVAETTLVVEAVRIVLHSCLVDASNAR